MIESNQNNDNPFKDIAPFNDEQVPSVLKRLINNPKLHYSLSKLMLPNCPDLLLNLVKHFVAYKLRRKTCGIKTIADVQNYMRPFLVKNLTTTTKEITFSGIKQLDKNKAYLFISNHRDIVVDPALINYLRDKFGQSTPRLAIGDNLLQQDFVADLMRLNKCFIVKRGLTNRREKLTAAKLLSSYIWHCLTLDKSSVWLAQAQGRAKNGNDKTSSAMLKMLQLQGSKQEFSEFWANLNLVAISISYEFDPCDVFKARELYQIATFGSYQKQAGEDDRSIAQGVTGAKGRVNVSFVPIAPNSYTDLEQLELALDNAIYANYKLYPLNYLAYSLWQEKPFSLDVPKMQDLFSLTEINQAKQYWQQKIAHLEPEIIPYLIMQYAYPVHNFYQTS